MLADWFTLAWFLLTVFCAIAIHVRDGRIAALERANDFLRDDLAEALHERNEARQAHGHLSERAGAYLREATLLVAENEQLKRGDMLDADAIVEDVARWLEARP